MASKNTSPFLVQTWSVEGWTDGWTVAKAYTVETGTYLFLLKSQGYGGDDKNVHISVIEPEGKVGAKRFTKKWTEGYTSGEFFSVAGKPYLLLIKAKGLGSDGNNIHVHEVLPSGDIRGDHWGKKVDEGWTNARVFSVGSSQFLFLLNTPTGAVEIHPVEPNGTIGAPLPKADWSSGWTTAEFYSIGGSTYLFLMKEDGGAVHINRMNADGTVGTRVETYDWTDGWTLAKSFEASGRPYLFLLKENTGTVHINQIRSGGAVGSHVCQYAREPSYTDKFETGSLADWGPRPWTSGWTTVEPFEMGGRTYLFALKTRLEGNQEKRAKIYRVNPMQAVGPMVSYVDTDEATIWVGTVGSPMDGSVKLKPPQGAVQHAPLEFSGGDEGYYRSGKARLVGLTPNTKYTYSVKLGDVPFGEGAFQTAPPRGRGEFTVAVVSCMDLDCDRVQNVWQHVRSRQPSLMLQIGDNAYPNTTMRSMIWAEHLQQRGVAAFADTIRHIPSLATWDDHDFGPNNSAGADVELENRKESQNAFRELFPGLPYHGSEGIYYKAAWGDVDFFMLDNRYFRNRYKNGWVYMRKMLGETQWSWLTAALTSSNAKFKVIVSGTTVDTTATETWTDNYPLEWARLKSLVADHRGVFLVTGDIHKCRVEHHELAGGKTLWEVISSGITGQEGNAHAFATLAFDTRTPGKEQVVCHLLQQDGTERAGGRTIKLTEMT